MDESDADFPVTPEILLRAYAAGIFPMAEDADDPGLHWVEPQRRGIIPLENFHVSARLARFVRHNPFRVVVNRDFDAVIAGCAAPRGTREETWINRDIRRLYRQLFDLGYCHTIEICEGEALVGGLYGIALGAAFFGESMFHRARDCSKLALIHLVARLKAGGFTLLDTQFVTDHLRQFGAIEITRAAYRRRLDIALGKEADFHIWPQGSEPTGEEIVRLAMS